MNRNNSGIIGLNGEALTKRGITELPAPFHNITENAAAEVLAVLTKITRHPSRCLSKGQLGECAEKAISANVILESRVQRLELYIGEFLMQCNQVPEDDPVGFTVSKMCNELLKVLRGTK